MGLGTIIQSDLVIASKMQLTRAVRPYHSTLSKIQETHSSIKLPDEKNGIPHRSRVKVPSFFSIPDHIRSLILPEIDHFAAFLLLF
jgi:hypothetical protein